MGRLRQRLVRTAAAVLAGGLLLAGCDGDGGTSAPSPTEVSAAPAVPHVRGPIEVVLQPALRYVAGGGCRPAPGQGKICAPDGSATYRALGTPRPATVVAVRTAPSEDHTAWDTVVRIDPDDRPVVRAAGEQAAGFGGVVLLLAAGRPGRAVEVLEPPSLTSGNVQVFGLEKPEAWAFVETFRGL